MNQGFIIILQKKKYRIILFGLNVLMMIIGYIYLFKIIFRLFL